MARTAGLLSLGLLFGSIRPAYAQFAVIDFSNLANTLGSLVELRQQTDRAKRQFDVIQRQATNWKDMGAGDWLDFGSNAVDLGFRADDIFSIASGDLVENFSRSFPESSEWDEDTRRLPSADQVAQMVDRSNALVRQNEIRGRQILRARDQADRVIERARGADTEAQVAASQVELQAIQVDEAQRNRELLMQTADLAAQQAALAGHARMEEERERQRARDDVASMNAARAAQRVRSREVTDSMVAKIRATQ